MPTLLTLTHPHLILKPHRTFRIISDLTTLQMSHFLKSEKHAAVSRQCLHHSPLRSPSDRLSSRSIVFNPIYKPAPSFTSTKLLAVNIDWTLLSSELDFIYLDPVLASHLGEQADGLVGKSLLAFVHPDEEASAKKDLSTVPESRSLHGSVTRSVSEPITRHTAEY